MIALRVHQAQAQAVAQEILAGSQINEIVLAVTPGGGKSGVPVILAALLIPSFAERLLWIVPRNSLKWQGEAEFVDPRWQTQRRLRACTGNEPAPDRGLDGYLTTYQAVGLSSAAHLEYVTKHQTIVFLDEPHHVSVDSTWANALEPILAAAVLVVRASGTFSRGDGKAIQGLEYRGALVDLTERPGVRVIRYGRRQAVADGAIIAPELVTIDGAARWVDKDGADKSVESLNKAGDERADAIFTALRTDYAFSLLASCMKHWEEHLRSYPQAKLLVVAPDIETAKTYHQRLASACLSEIATSDESAQARKAIDEFKRGAFPCLVTVGMAYEGLSVPEVTHIACLTQIRSVPWLEQMQARANRRALGKTGAWVFAPADRALIEAWRMIETEALVPLSEASQDRTKAEPSEGSGGAAPSICPLWSTAHGLKEGQLELQPRPIPPSVGEGILRDNIRAMRVVCVDQARPGSRMAKATIWNATVRRIVDKNLDDMDTQELNAVWVELKSVFRGKS